MILGTTNIKLYFYVFCATSLSFTHFLGNLKFVTIFFLNNINTKIQNEIQHTLNKQTLRYKTHSRWR